MAAVLELAESREFGRTLDAFCRVPLHQSGQIRWFFLVKGSVLKKLLDQGLRVQALSAVIWSFHFLLCLQETH